MRYGIGAFVLCWLGVPFSLNCCREPLPARRKAFLCLARQMDGGRRLCRILCLSSASPFDSEDADIELRWGDCDLGSTIATGLLRDSGREVEILVSRANDC
jgi:hypothetical protein